MCMYVHALERERGREGGREGEGGWPQLSQVRKKEQMKF